MMRLWLIRHGAPSDGRWSDSGHVPPLPHAVLGKRKICIHCYMMFPLTLFLRSELERAQHTARLVLSDRQLPVHIIPELNEMFLVTGRCDIIATSCKKMPKTIARGAITGSMLSPRTVSISGIFTTCGTLHRKA
ncbi:histidine phosphatase family protein [Shigella boydii]